MQKVIILGAAHPFRGGIATFNERMARAFIQAGYDVTIYNFSLQYPSFLFPGKTQYSSDPAPADLKILSKVNSVNPLNWLKVGWELRRLKPDLVIAKFWIPLMGPALGTILRIVGKNRHTKIISIIDNAIPHEKRFGDYPFTKYFFGACDGFITMSDKVMNDLRSIEKKKPAVLTFHPLYDNFGEAISKQDARLHLQELLRTDLRNVTLLLFFGFIRKYKGLDLLFEAMHIVKEKHPELKTLKLLVAGEFYEEEKYYTDLIRKLAIGNMLILNTNFIADQDVKIYFCAADVVVQPYRNATQSGVTPLAYHFEKPMIVTRVGALPDYVPHQKVGLVADPDPASIAAAILEYRQLGESYFIPHLRAEKQKYTWDKLVDAITELAKGIVTKAPTQ
jgi:glycosyltransferase involved in cell wall biosynthesis